MSDDLFLNDVSSDDDFRVGAGILDGVHMTGNGDILQVKKGDELLFYISKDGVGASVDIVPSSPNTDIGCTTRRFRKVYVDDLVTSTINGEPIEDKYVSREEFDELRRRLDQLTLELFNKGVINHANQS